MRKKISNCHRSSWKMKSVTIAISTEGKIWGNIYLPIVGNIFPLGTRNLSLAIMYDSSILSLTSNVPAEQCQLTQFSVNIFGSHSEYTILRRAYIGLKKSIARVVSSSSNLVSYKIYHLGHIKWMTEES